MSQKNGCCQVWDVDQRIRHNNAVNRKRLYENEIVVKRYDRLWQILRECCHMYTAIATKEGHVFLNKIINMLGQPENLPNLRWIIIRLWSRWVLPRVLGELTFRIQKTRMWKLLEIVPSRSRFVTKDFLPSSKQINYLL